MIIAFVGFKQVGKTTAAKYLEDKYGFVRHNFKDGLIVEMKQNFPDTLKQIAAEEGMTVDELFTKKPPVVRALMMNYGTEVRRNEHPGYWVYRWNESIVHKIAKDIVTDDVRFLNEALAIKSRSGIIIRLTRPDLPTGSDHKSETEQLQIKADYTIDCEAGDFDRLYTELDRIIEIHK